MNLQKILERFAIIASLSMDEVSPWIPVCEEACEETRRHLREETDEDENSRKLNVTAAALAFYRYVLYRTAGGGMESFSAGELRIKTNAEASIKMAYNVWKDAKNAVADLLTDDDFMFERIV